MTVTHSPTPRDVRMSQLKPFDVYKPTKALSAIIAAPVFEAPHPEPSPLTAVVKPEWLTLDDPVRMLQSIWDGNRPAVVESRVNRGRIFNLWFAPAKRDGPSVSRLFRLHLPNGPQLWRLHLVHPDGSPQGWLECQQSYPDAPASGRFYRWSDSALRDEACTVGVWLKQARQALA